MVWDYKMVRFHPLAKSRGFQLTNDNGFITHYGKIEELDTHIQDADKLIIAMFCADQDAIILYSFDKMIINSEKIIKYVKEIGKKIKEVT